MYTSLAGGPNHTAQNPKTAPVNPASSIASALAYLTCFDGYFLLQCRKHHVNRTIYPSFCLSCSRRRRRRRRAPRRAKTRRTSPQVPRQVVQRRVDPISRKKKRSPPRRSWPRPKIRYSPKHARLRPAAHHLSQCACLTSRHSAPSLQIATEEEGKRLRKRARTIGTFASSSAGEDKSLCEVCEREPPVGSLGKRGNEPCGTAEKA
jgi:hypothetical protein